MDTCLLIGIELMKLTDVMVQSFDSVHDLCFMVVQRVFYFALSDLHPLLYRLSFSAQVQSHKDTIPVVFGLKMVPFEDQPRVEDFLFQSINPESIIHGTLCLFSLYFLPILDTFYVEINSLPEQTKSQSSHYGVSTLFLIFHILYTIPPSTDC